MLKKQITLVQVNIVMMMMKQVQIKLVFVLNNKIKEYKEKKNSKKIKKISYKKIINLFFYNSLEKIKKSDNNLII